MSTRHLLPLLLLALAAAPDASAQIHQWRDANGRMVYSDTPPPASVPPSAVIRSPARPTSVDGAGGPGTTANPAGSGPSMSARAQAAAAAASVESPRPGADAAPRASAADQAMEFQKRRLERQEAERKAAEQNALIEKRAQACESARAQVRTLESGMRLMQLNKDGERVIVDDETRTRQLEQARRTAAETCTKT